MFSNGEPFLRYAAKSAYFVDRMVIARDCRVLYIISGEGEFITKSRRYPLTMGALVYYPAQTPYHITSEKGMIFYTLNFDFTHERAEMISPFPPEPYHSGGQSCELPFIPEELGKTVFLPNACALEPYVFGTFLEAERKSLFSEEAKSAALKLLLIKIARMRDSCQSSLAQRIKTAVISDVRKNNIEIASSLGYHPYYVNEVFSRAEGVSLHKFIMRERLIKARELITTTDRALEDIAADCGFSSSSHLSASVRREFGIAPSKMRKI